MNVPFTADMESVLTLHFPNTESGYPADRYRIFCDAPGCGFATTIEPYGKVMSAFIAHQAATLAAAGFRPVRADEQRPKHGPELTRSQYVQAKQSEAWSEGYDKGTDLAAWAIGNRPQSERPDTANPYEGGGNA